MQWQCSSVCLSVRMSPRLHGRGDHRASATKGVTDVSSPMKKLSLHDIYAGRSGHSGRSTKGVTMSHVFRHEKLPRNFC